ncbi:MAG: ATP-grasp domain-containing protein [Candidatus Gastranaerophilaceae bacterium]
MFILEKPYVSDLLLSTLEKNQILVLKNAISEKALNNYKLNLIDDNKAIEELNKDSNVKIYSNSENSIDWILKTLPNSNVARLINICKNKYEFRKQIKSIYPNFYFDKVELDELDKIDINSLPQKFIIKPSVGFLSMGVHKVNSHSEWNDTLAQIKLEISEFKKHFPNSVLSSSEFIIEEVIEGVEFAIDAYFNNLGEAVILNIFQHPFVSEDDVSDRAYISSKEIIESNLDNFTQILNKIGNALNIKNFPMHIEVIKKQNSEVIPVEINPLRFAGWCTTDLAEYAYGINIYEYFNSDKKPEWDNILKNKENKIYYFAMAETPANIQKGSIDFDYIALQHSFSKILSFRPINYLEKPLFAIIFGESESLDEINNILQLDMNSFISNKQILQTI